MLKDAHVEEINFTEMEEFCDKRDVDNWGFRSLSFPPRSESVTAKYITVKLGYKDLGYNDHDCNEFMVITNKNLRICRSQKATFLHKPSWL